MSALVRYAFRIVNVFAVEGDRFSGNPLCVFEDARGLSTEQMQALARQMNLSETTFVLPSDRATAKVRIFTPGFEMPFAGHPTLGTAFVVGGDALAFEMEVGLVAVVRDGGALSLQTARPPTSRPVAASRSELARMLSLPEDAIAGDPLWMNTGVEQLVIPVASAELVRSAKPVASLLEEHGFSESRDEAMAYLWSSEPEWVVRFFFTSNGAVLEDPATGSACANLGGYLLTCGRAPVEVTLRQGDAIHRASRLGLRVTTDGAIHVSGLVTELGSGSIEL